MSFRVAIAVEDRVLDSPTSKLVMLKLALCGNDDGESVRPSVWTIASDTQTSERTVQRVLKAAVDNGLLKVTKEEDPRHKLPKVYRIDLERLNQLPLTEAAQERRRRKQERAGKAQNPNGEGVTACHPSSQNGCQPVHERVTQCRGTGDTVSPDPLEEPLEDPSARDARDPGPGVAGASRPAQAEATEKRDPGSEQTEPPRAGHAEATDQGDGEASEPAPANAHWKAKRQELEEAFGSAWGSWFKDIVPITDDGDLLVLGAPSKFWRDHVAVAFTDLLQSVLQRRVKLAIFNPSVIAALDRDRMRAEKAAAASDQPP